MSSSQLRRRQASHHEQPHFLRQYVDQSYDTCMIQLTVRERMPKMVFDHVMVLQENGSSRTKGAFQGWQELIFGWWSPTTYLWHEWINGWGGCTETGSLGLHAVAIRLDRLSGWQLDEETGNGTPQSQKATDLQFLQEYNDMILSTMTVPCESYCPFKDASFMSIGNYPISLSDRSWVLLADQGW